MAIERGQPAAADEEEEEIVCLESFFINDDYQLTKFTFGAHVLQLLCLQSASTDFDLTGQLVWPGAMLMNNYLSENPVVLQGCSVIELGSGVGVTGILSSRFCNEVVLTDHNEEVLKVLKKNVELHLSSENSNGSAGLIAEKLEWGNSDHLNHILERHSEGFDLVLGADIYDFTGYERPSLTWCHFVYSSHNVRLSSVPFLFDTVQQLLRIREEGHCKFLLAYVSRTKAMDRMVVNEAIRHGLQITEVIGSQSVVGNLEGVIFEITMKTK